jgi:hypothetical protein
LTPDNIAWLLKSNKPWTHWRTFIDELVVLGNDPELQAARTKMLVHPQGQTLIREGAWPGTNFQRHKDAGHPLCKLTILADFGLRAVDPGMAEII